MAEKFKGTSVSLANLPAEDPNPKKEYEAGQSKIIPEVSGEYNEETYEAPEEAVENIRDDMWWAYLKKNPNDGVNALPPHIDKCYQEFSAILRDTNTPYTLVKTENNVNIYKNEEDPHFTIYKCSFFIEGDFYDMVRILQSDSNEKLWNLYLKSHRLKKRLGDNIQVFKAQYEIDMWNFIVSLNCYYLREAWIHGNKFDLIRSSLGPSEKDYSKNILTFDLPLELFALRLQTIEGSYEKNRLTIIVKLRKSKIFLKNRTYERFIKKYLVAFTIIRDECEDILQQVSKLPLTLSPSESPESRGSPTVRDPYAEMNKPPKKQQPVQPPVETKAPPTSGKRELDITFEKKETEDPVISKLLLKPEEPKPKKLNYVPAPTLIELPTPEKKKAFEVLKSKIKSKGIHLSDELIIRFLISKEFNIDDAYDYIEKYDEFMKTYNFDKLTIHDPEFEQYKHLDVPSFMQYNNKDRYLVSVEMIEMDDHYSWSSAEIITLTDRNQIHHFINLASPHELFRKYFYTWVFHVIKSFQPGVEQLMLLLDMTDLTSDNSNLSQTKELLKALQNFYPAYTYKIFVINGGLLIRSIYFAIKGLLKQRVKDRIIFCSTSGKEAYNALKEFADDDNIPVFLGGKNMND